MNIDTTQNLNPPVDPLQSSLQPPVAENPLEESAEMSRDQRRAIIGIVIAVIVLIALIILSVVFLINQSPNQVARIRDIFIIFLAIQSLLTGLALVILLIQLARLINLLQNEIKPILDSTNETVSNLRGTTTFLSNNLVEPVIKLNEYLAGLTQLAQVIGFIRKSSKKQYPKE